MAFASITTQYRGVWRIVRRYWDTYGGFPALITSPYFHLSLILTAITYPEWTAPGWWDTIISVMPSIIGFSLGGYAIWLAFGEDRFRALIGRKESGQKTSPYMAVNAAFVHFILMQILALLLALIANAYDFESHEDPILGGASEYINLSFSTVATVFQFISGMLGYWLFIYALLMAIAATFAILRVSSWYDEYLAKRTETEEEVNASKNRDISNTK